MQASWGFFMSNFAPLLKAGSKGVDALVDALRAFKGPQEEAMLLAQQRAALPIEKGGLGLPPTNTAMDRAKAMGFDADVFHGTNKDIQQFAPKQYNKGDKKTMLFDVGTHGSFNPATANDYAMASQFGEKYARGLASGMDVAEGLSPVVYPLKMNTSKMLDATVPFSDEVTNKILQKGDEFFSSRNRKNVQLKDVEPSMFLQELQSKMGRPKFEKFIRNDLGSDAVKYEWGGPNIVNMNPDNIRSRFAAFDPWRKTAATAATFGVAAPDLLAQELRNK